MATSWKRANENALRAHLQEALAQRAATADARDWSYSDYDIAAIRSELNERQVAHAALRDGAEGPRPSGPPPDVACESCEQARAPMDPDAVRLRMLIARCFKPSRRPHEQATSRESGILGGLAADKQRLERNTPMRFFARLQRLR
jgi:hypothetical protein